MNRRPIILIADDFPDACEMYAAYLQHHGMDVVTAADGGEAVSAARKHAPDIILLDIRMPSVTGTEAMRILKADAAFAGVPIVALTAQALPRERDAALAAGFDAYLSKPLAPDMLLKAVRDLLQGRNV